MASLETETTAALLDAMRTIGNALRIEFVGRVLGVLISPRSGEIQVKAEVPQLPGVATRRTALVGLAMSTAIDWSSEDRVIGSRVDAVFLQDPEVLVLVEVKIGTARLDGWQLIRHATAWDIQVPAQAWDPNELPQPVATATWASAAAWIDEMDHPPEVLTELRARLRKQELDSGPVELDRPRIAGTKALKAPTPAPLGEILANVDLPAICQRIREQFGRGAPGYVRAPKEVGPEVDTREDSAQVRAAYAAAQAEEPGGLRASGGDVVTPRRALSILATPGLRTTRDKMFVMPTWGDVRQRVRTRGGDRGLAVAFYAFAQELAAQDRKKLEEHAGRLWVVLEPRTPAAAELTELLDAMEVPR